MLKRFGILSLVLSAGALLQPAAALAAGPHDRVSEQRNNVRVVEPYRAASVESYRVAPRYNVRDRFDRHDRREVVRVAPEYVPVTPAPQCWR